MAIQKQKTAPRKNIRKAQEKRKSTTKLQHRLAQPEGRKRKIPGTTGRGKFYHIEVRPKGDFVMFRNQDVGKKGGLERLAGKRSNGNWDTVTWLISKDIAHIDKYGHLKIDDMKARTFLKQIRGRITHVKGDVFKAKPAMNSAKHKKTQTGTTESTRKLKKPNRHG